MSTLLKICNYIQPFNNILKPVVNSSVTTVRYRIQNFSKKRFPHWYAKRDRVLHNDHISKQNKDFIKEVIESRLIKGNLGVVGPAASVAPSPLKEEPIEPTTAVWDNTQRRTGVIAKKIGVYPLYNKKGKRLLCTLLQVVDNHVISYTPPEEHNSPIHRAPIIKRKLGCLVVGAETGDPETYTKEYCGLFTKSGVPPKRWLARFFVTPDGALQPGTPLLATHFRPGDYIDTYSQTINRGFQGVMKRWGYKGQPATHGQTKTHRRPGCIGSGRDRGVMPGTKLPGHMGNQYRVLKGLRIARINTKYQVIWVLGQAIPGSVGCRVKIFDSLLSYRALAEDRVPPHFPTRFINDDEEIEEELYADDMHKWDDPTISYTEETK